MHNVAEGVAQNEFITQIENLFDQFLAVLRPNFRVVVFHELLNVFDWHIILTISEN